MAPEAKFAALIEGTRPGLGSETADLLRGRLKIGAPLLCITVALFTLHSAFFANTTYPIWSPAIIAVIFAALSGLLWSRMPLTLGQLRLVELILFGLMALNYVANQYVDALGWADQGDTAETMARITSTRQAAYAIMATYALFIPNTWRRALMVLTAMAFLPALVPLVMWFHDPEAYALLRSGMGVEAWTYVAIWMIVGVAITASGTHIIQVLRVEAYEAKQLGQYKLTAKIGAGGMGEVWKAEHRLLARPAAIKLVKPEMLDARTADEARTTLGRFEREAQATASLRSVHTIEIYDFGITDEGVFYYVMEILDGLDLENLVKQFGSLSAARTIYLLRQACDSLAEAHEHGLIHRDIKPANLFTCRMGRACDFVKILDFGLVKSDPHQGQANAESLTVEGMTAGTPAFMSPEQVLSKPHIDDRSDIYSLGCVAFWMLTGQYLFEGESPMEVAVHQVNTEPPSPSERSETGVPTDLEEVVLACLQKDPNNRPSSAAALAERLAKCESAVGWTETDAQAWWGLHMPGAAASPSPSDQPTQAGG
jgi:tRNA A-37 threonylcarbamoyl transferase component Bud32